jgi:NAD(P)-dependent dehydrogenase (short-subunit alcohol dehydrogenase family)
MSRKIAFLGASKGMGRALARRLAARGDRLFLLGRDLDDLGRSARDLKARAGTDAGGTPVGVAACDLERPETFAAALDAAAAGLGGLDTVVVTGGMFATQDKLEADPELAHRLLTVDFANTVVFCEEARRRLLAQGGGTLCVFSSVAGERGRKPVILYGAAKAGLTRYLEGLDHKFRAQGLRTVCVKPGFVRTGMTEGLRPPPFAGEPDAVAGRVLRAIDRGQPVVYAPGIWALIMLVIRWLPRLVMRRIGF